jgi:subtilase family serine protease
VGFTFASGSSSAGPCTAIGQKVSCPINSLAPQYTPLSPGPTEVITISALTSSSAGSFTIATVIDPANTNIESNEANNAASATGSVSAAFADLTAAVTGPTSVALNSKPTYVITISNSGNDAAAANKFTVYLAGYDRIDSLVAPAGYTCTVRKDHSAGRYVDCVTTSLAAATSVTLQIVAAGAYARGLAPVTVSADALNAVQELSETNNISTFVTTIV